MTVLSRRVEIVNSRGLHARAAAKVVKLSDGFASELWIARGGERVSARSIMGLLMLAAGPGDEIEVQAEGADAPAALAALVGLVATGFGER